MSNDDKTRVKKEDLPKELQDAYDLFPEFMESTNAPQDLHHAPFTPILGIYKLPEEFEGAYDLLPQIIKNITPEQRDKHLAFDGPKVVVAEDDNTAMHQAMLDYAEKREKELYRKLRAHRDRLRAQAAEQAAEEGSENSEENSNEGSEEGSENSEAGSEESSEEYNSEEDFEGLPRIKIALNMFYIPALKEGPKKHKPYFIRIYSNSKSLVIPAGQVYDGVPDNQIISFVMGMAVLYDSMFLQFDVHAQKFADRMVWRSWSNGTTLE